MAVDHAADRRLQQLRRYTRLLDDGIPVPGTRFRVGLDPVFGLVPGFGDALGALLGAAILVEAARRGLPRSVLLRMVLNIAADAGIGTVPVLGDVFDALWKANRKNLALLEGQLGVGPAAKPVSGWAIAIVLTGILLVCLGVAVGAVLLVSWLL